MNPADLGTENLILYSVLATFLIGILARFAWGLTKNRVIRVEKNQETFAKELKIESEDRKLVDQRFHDQQTLLTQRIENNQSEVGTIKNQLKAGVDRFAQQDAKIGAVLESSVSKAEFGKAQDIHEKSHDKLDRQIAKMVEAQQETAANISKLSGSQEKGFAMLQKIVMDAMPLVGKKEKPE
jgi:hypothetical protein